MTTRNVMRMLIRIDMGYPWLKAARFACECPGRPTRPRLGPSTCMEGSGSLRGTGGRDSAARALERRHLALRCRSALRLMRARGPDRRGQLDVEPAAIGFAKIRIGPEAGGADAGDCAQII